MKKISKKMTLWLMIALTLVGLIGVAFTFVDDFAYSRPIAKITSTENTRVENVTDEWQNHDKTYHQAIKATITNGQYKGQHVTLSNTYTKTMALDQPYKKGQKVFLSIKKTSGKTVKQASIYGFKRDTYLAFTLWLALSLLILTTQFQGLLAIFSVLLNCVLFFLAIQIDLALHASHVLLIFGTLAVIFAVLTLFLILGPTTKYLAAVITTIIGMLVTIILSMVVLNLTHAKGVYLESMSYVTQLPTPLFLAECMLGSLGAIMDEATDIISTLFELKAEKPDLTQWQIFQSGLSVGKNIMGPLINVLLLIFMADTFTMSILFIRNFNHFGYTFNMNMSLGVTQTLISGIGIVLAIPIASLLCGFWLRRRQKA